MVEVVVGWFNREISPNDQRAFRAETEEDLVHYHGTLGRRIRNHFKLWLVDHTPQIVDDVDISRDHPDQISMRVIIETWKRIQ